MVYSPLQKSFVQITKDSNLTYSPEEYMNYTGGLQLKTWLDQVDLNSKWIFYKELTCLCELIGAVGVKYLVDLINVIIFENLMRLKEIVIQNKETLYPLRINFERPEAMKELYKQLESK